ncbi:Glycosyltransferase involved in cell wall bisynthesis [Thiohalospira halophila DSM 15071]|uniref:Glycosyltransferase involved in cell wall bisynthesis n=1 Tax=Thiohalospira halophila DSM 15071 TaxID=1123397 RepID=A0A1I1RRG9_9GAMM|nr:glycosyltransferase family 2 protein [Thiohalospira halophila]SFD36949.1 Glycosyltransferase involved in cell wall bisynthesis [Thiohalospira halophila DSM 15071]
MRVFVFSYNRGQYLKNCIQSLWRHMPNYPITIVDDGSTDPEVIETLDCVRGYADVIVNDREEKSYLGGLYNNMQFALDSSVNCDLALFIQDDQQIVRPIERFDEKHWDDYFSRNPTAHELGTTFLKRGSKADSDGITIDCATGVYFRDPRVSKRAYFTATGIFNVARMRKVSWRFGATEGENNLKAHDEKFSLGFSAYPFMMWLPNAKSSKFQRKGHLHALAEWYRCSGFYPYRDMTSDEVNWLKYRSIEKLPYAQDILHPLGLKPNQDWLFEDATKSIRWIHRRLKKRKKKMARNQALNRE